LQDGWPMTLEVSVQHPAADDPDQLASVFDLSA
jgi:hypothetical protein